MGVAVVVTVPIDVTGDGLHGRDGDASAHRRFGRFATDRSAGSGSSFRPIRRTPPGPYIDDVSDDLVSTLLAEPPVADPPRRVGRDRVLVGAVAVGALIEALVRPDLALRPWSMVAVALAGLTLLRRRRRPLAMMAVTIATFVALDLVALLVDGRSVDAVTSIFLLVHVYALFRWGSGRHCLWGIGLMAAISAFALTVSWTGFGDAIGGAVVLVLPAVAGIEVRHLGQRRERDRERVKTFERELLARELHDTVAHHVSAIAVQAQAGRVVGARRPEAALDALAVIEAEASRTLAEMRTIVGTLREGRGAVAAEFAPQAGIDDIHRLAEGSILGTGPRVVVDIDGVDDVGPAVGAALYRVTQEALTNARRHAVEATRVDVRIDRDGSDVRLAVVDDGVHQRSRHDASGGFGLLGMTERAELLGGTLRAGPDGERGWRVEATIPVGTTP